MSRVEEILGSDQRLVLGMVVDPNLAGLGGTVQELVIIVL
jgi:hypothetical protein